MTLAVLSVAGCHIDVVRGRAGNPLPREEYAKLEEKKTTRSEALDRLGAPEKVEWKNGKDYFWYLYRDGIDTGLRFQFPPFRTFFGYQHTFLRMDEAAADTNAIQLVFDENNVLEHKSLRLPDAYEDPNKPAGQWVFSFDTSAEYSFMMLGDGGVRDFEDIFHKGYRVSGTIGFQPAPVVTILGRFGYERHEGASFDAGNQPASVSDLKLYLFEVGMRLTAPLELLWEFSDYEKVRKVFFEDNAATARGLRLYVEGTTGGAFNDEVGAKINGVKVGALYDRGVQFTGSLAAGLEYVWGWGAAHIQISYQTIDPFDEGNSNIDDDADAFQAVLVGGGLTLRF